jgi:hypothetical protein
MHTAGDCKGGLPLHNFRPHSLAPDREQGTRLRQPTYTILLTLTLAVDLTNGHPP